MVSNSPLNPSDETQNLINPPERYGSGINASLVRTSNPSSAVSSQDYDPV